MAVGATFGLWDVLFTRLICLHVLPIFLSNLLGERLEGEQLIVQVAGLGLPQEVLCGRSSVPSVAIEWIQGLGLRSRLAIGDLLALDLSKNR
jgi:hypothetical protein